ncbi:MAG: hypothetical protein Q7R39_10195 [Dehalococcoidia bacterium]|nr:hypothetical protein [Dehalococcoidia bacterium]
MFVSAEVINVPGPTAISSTWIYLNTNETIDTVTVQAPVDTSVQFSLPKPPAMAWPVGQYRVVLLINGVEAASMNYSVQ